MSNSARERFREGVFARDRRRCVVCTARASDAHHLLERRLFPDGGYVLDNGVSLCSTCHLDAEATLISPDHLRERAGIRAVVCAPGLDPRHRHDKWGNPVLSDGTRLRGPLAAEEPVRMVLARAGLASVLRPWPAPPLAAPGAPLPGNVLVTCSRSRLHLYADGAHDEDLAVFVLGELALDLRGIASELAAGWCAVISGGAGAGRLEELWAEDALLAWHEHLEWAPLLGLDPAASGDLPAGDGCLSRPSSRVARADYEARCRLHEGPVGAGS